MIKTVHFNTFQKYVAAILTAPLRIFNTPNLTTQALQRTERYFEDYKWQ